MYKQLGTILGVDFEMNTYPSDGFQLTLNNADTGETLFDSRMIGYTLWEAVCAAVGQVWEEEIKQHNEYGLPSRVATVLGIPEMYDDDEEEI